VIVAGTASKPEIKLQSQPQLAQADILSLILFGTTTSQLGQGKKRHYSDRRNRRRRGLRAVLSLNHWVSHRSA
jgi:hypothetical protein